MLGHNAYRAGAWSRLGRGGGGRGRLHTSLLVRGGPHGRLSVVSWKGLHHLRGVTLEGCPHLHPLWAGGGD